MWDSLEAISQDEMAALQAERLRDCVARVAANVPMYQGRLGAAGIMAEDVRSLDDLARLPFTVKQDLRDNYPYGLFAVPMDEVVRLHASSGTTGKMTVVGYTANDISMWADLAARALSIAGVDRRDVIHVAYGYGLFTGGLGLHYGGERLGATVVPVSAGNTRRQVELAQDFGATVLCCTPSYSLLIAEQATEAGVDLSRLRVGVFGAEPWSEEMRSEIETRLGILALDIYGLSEVMGPAVSMECPYKRGLHLAEDHFIPEVVDPTTGEPLTDGDIGELTLTCVTKEALPLLRYRTGDLTRLERGQCECGRTTARMSKPLGRTDDMLIIRGVNVFPSQIEAELLRIEGLEPHYELHLTRGESQMDELAVRVEASEELIEDEDVYAIVGRTLSATLQSALGLGCRVDVVAPRELPRSEGKAVRIVDNRRI
ncbi:MAG: phenylacetate--CoA ligase [Chloroflexi bacterium]|nr:phenylacetate--CoA ligase [Chloroflexota bacterium]MYE40905.1 phenylacetate--CoA ligase [Chloroflexota bacterium]